MTTVVRRAEPGDLELSLEPVAEYCEADQRECDATAAGDGLEPLLADDPLGAIWMSKVLA